MVKVLVASPEEAKTCDGVTQVFDDLRRGLIVRALVKNAPESR